MGELREGLEVVPIHFTGTARTVRDILLLAHHFLQLYRTRHVTMRRSRRLSPEATVIVGAELFRPRYALSAAERHGRS